MAILIRLLLVASVLALSACSPYVTFRAYAGPERSEHDVATLYVMTPGVYVTAVDNDEAPRGLVAEPDQTPRIFLAPGRHTVTVRYRASSTIGPWVTDSYSAGSVTLEYSFESGRHYSLEANVGATTWKPHIRQTLFGYRG